MSYIGMAANVVGGVMQAAAATQANRSMFNTMQDEVTRQQQFGAQEWAPWRQGLENSSAETAQTQLGQGASQRLAGYDQANQAPLIAGQGPVGTPADMARLHLAGQARANVGSYSDWTLNQAINKIRTQEAMNKISQFAQGDAQVFPFQMYKAQHSADELAALGAMISSIGGGGNPMPSSSPQGNPAAPGSFGHGNTYSPGMDTSAGWMTLPGSTPYGVDYNMPVNINENPPTSAWV